MENENKKIVCFGGGNVVPKLIMQGLKKYPTIITGITSMVDNGGSTGQLREDFNVLPSGDIRRHILALSDAPEWKKKLWQFRFGHEVFDGGHKGHSFANAFICGTEDAVRDYEKVLEIVHEFMEVKGHQALPATTDNVQLIAEAENGERIEGEDEIDVPQKHDPNLKIQKVFLEPEGKAFEGSLKAISEADALIFGPGDVYSSIIPCFLPLGMKEAIAESKAKKILISNAMTKLGETGGFSVSDFTSEIEKYIGTQLDYVIYDGRNVDSERLDNFKEENSELLEIVKNDSDDERFIDADILEDSGPIVYNSEKISKTIMSLI